MTKIKMSKIAAGILYFVRLFAPFLTSCRLGAGYYLLTVFFCQGSRVGSLRDFVVVSGAFDVWTIAAVYHLDVTVLIFCNDPSCLLVETVFNYLDACIEVYLEGICSPRQ